MRSDYLLGIVIQWLLLVYLVEHSVVDLFGAKFV